MSIITIITINTIIIIIRDGIKQDMQQSPSPLSVSSSQNKTASSYSTKIYLYYIKQTMNYMHTLAIQTPNKKRQINRSLMSFTQQSIFGASFVAFALQIILQPRMKINVILKHLDRDQVSSLVN